MAGGHYSTGGAFLLYPSYRPHSTANIRIDNESGVTVFIGATNIGQGSNTVICQMAAEMLGIDYRDVHLVCQDTMLAPMDNGTYDSRLTYGAGHAVKSGRWTSAPNCLRTTSSLWGCGGNTSSAPMAKFIRCSSRKKRMPLRKRFTSI